MLSNNFKSGVNFKLFQNFHLGPFCSCPVLINGSKRVLVFLYTEGIKYFQTVWQFKKIKVILYSPIKTRFLLIHCVKDEQTVIEEGNSRFCLQLSKRIIQGSEVIKHTFEIISDLFRLRPVILSAYNFDRAPTLGNMRIFVIKN